MINAAQLHVSRLSIKSAAVVTGYRSRYKRNPVPNHPLEIRRGHYSIFYIEVYVSIRYGRWFRELAKLFHRLKVVRYIDRLQGAEIEINRIVGLMTDSFI